MKLSISKTARFCCGLTLLLSFTTVAQESQSITSPETVSPSEKVLARAPWRVSGKEGRLFCEVTQNEAGDGRSTRVLTIYKAEGGKIVKIFSFKTPDSLASMYQIGDYDGRFFTTWVAGSAFHIRAWAFADGHVKAVFDQDTKLVPELVYDEQGRESVLITDPVIENGKWTATNGTTTVFKWNGETYSRIGTLSWRNRFQCISVESCTSFASRSSEPLQHR